MKQNSDIKTFNKRIVFDCVLRSDLPEEKTSVLLLGVTKISSPVLQRRYSNKQNQKNRHTLHFPTTSTTEFNGIEDQQTGQQTTTITDVLTENSQNVDKQLKPQASPIKSLSFSNTKENTSPQLGIKSSSFSVQQRKNNNNNRKRVSFSNDLIRSRDIARFNRDIKKLENSEINHHYIEIPVGYYNNYTTEDDDTNLEDERPKNIPRGRRRSSVDLNEFDDILDEISNDLNIRPITSRRNSLADSYRKSSIDSETNRKHSSTSAPYEEILIEQTEDDEEIDVVDENFNKKINEKFYSENDIYDKLSPKIAQPRKLSAPLTSSVHHTDDYVNDFLNEIIDELNIGPNLRSRSQSIVTETTTPDKSSGEATSQIIDSSSCNGLVSSSITSEEDTASTTSSSSVPIPTTSSNSTVALTPPPIDVSEEADLEDQQVVDVTEEINSEDQQVIMDRSMDSIGSCSLDVDLSTDFSDSSRGSVSDCTLRSVSILTPISNGISSIKQQSKLNDESKQIVHDSSNDPIIKITDTTSTSNTVDQQENSSSSQTKKPSYLNLACCVNGYSNLTTYDSKLRETYRTGTSRSREVSPNRPLDNNVCGYNNYQMTKGGDDQQLQLSTYLTPESAKQQQQQRSTTLSPNHQRSTTMNKLKMSDEYHKINGSSTTNGDSATAITTATRKSTYFSSTTQQTTTTSYLSKENRTFASSMLFNKTSTDVTDDANCMNKENHFTYKNENGLINKYISKSMINTHNGSGSNGGGPPREYNSDISINESRIKISPSKSFIQQRVERLYGPGALAQGFFIQTKRHNCSTSPLKYEKYYDEDVNCNEKQIYTSDSTPSLPVLRHLRPEFRAQLPILSPKRNINNENGGLQKSTTIPIALKDNLPTPSATSTTNCLSPNRVIRSAESLNDSNDLQNDSYESIKELKNTKASENLILENLNESIITEHLPAAPQVILPVVSTIGTSDTLIIKNGGDCITNGEKELQILMHNESADDDKALVIDEQNKDGHYFLKILKNETERLNHLAEQVERELEEKMSELPDDALGYLRSASGKARLLVNQKMQQFEGLCHKNINQIEGEQFPTTAEDLQGFWDMVMLQVNQVNDLFKDLDELRENNWVVEIKPKKLSSDLTKARSKFATKKATPNVQSAPTTANGEMQRMKREAQRKLMLEQRRAAMMAKKKSNSNDNQNVEIFVPESSTSANLTS